MQSEREGGAKVHYHHFYLFNHYRTITSTLVKPAPLGHDHSRWSSNTFRQVTCYFHSSQHPYMVCLDTDNWRAQWKKGITDFDDPKRSKVNKAFSLSSKLLWLKFNSWICVLLKSSLVIFLDTKKCRLTFDLLGLSKTVIPFFHWALQLINYHNVFQYQTHWGLVSWLESTQIFVYNSLYQLLLKHFTTYCR